MPSPRRLLSLDPYFALLILLTVFAWAPLTYPGSLQTHAGFLPVFNLYDLESHLGNPAWWPLVGRGYDLWRGEGPLPYYLAVACRWLGFGGIGAVKLVIALSIVGGAWGVYGWARPTLGRSGALLAATVYAYWPYALATILVRGTWAETVWLGLLPLALWALAAARATGKGGNLIILSLAVAALAWTQPGLAAWALVAMTAYLAMGEAGMRGRALAALAGGVLLGAVGLAPQISARDWGGPAPVEFAQHFVYPFQFFLAGWGNGLSVAGWQDTLPLSPGMAAVGLALLALILGGLRPARGTLASAAAIAAVCLSLASTLSSPLWKLWPVPARTLTFPWQLLSLAGPFLAFLAGAAFPALVAQDVGRGRARSSTLSPEGRGEGEGRLLSSGRPSKEEFVADWEESEGGGDTSFRTALHAGLVALVVLASYTYLQPRYTTLEPGRAPIAILGDNQVMLLDVRLEGPLRAGEKVALAVHWQALKPIDRDYTIFVHALDEAGERWGQEDTQPQGGKYPMTRWLVGEIVEDRYEVSIRADGPAAGYHLILGLYDWQTGARLRVGDTDHVVVRE
ncbi:MAG: hypothetical protein IT330_14480 [Anaerolineae bacterium]|nr:hypothetical protein [Anaerolineae bacterium]